MDREGAERFLAPDYTAHIHDPFLLKDAEKAAERIIHAMEMGERITLYSDYDADGIPGAVMWNDFFKRLGYTNYSIYIPHRHNEGFGLNVEAVEQLAQEGVKLLITLDCGISDVEPVKRANELGIEVIITDHHEPPVVLPQAFAIIDHKQIDCTYPDKNICGSGVGFKLIQAIIKKVVSGKLSVVSEKITKEAGETVVEKFQLNWKEGHEKWFLDMVGIATLSDMVPLIGENRVFAYYGLSVLRKSPRKGLVRLISKLKMSQPHLTEDDIGFMITPRINAASRMGVPMDAFRLLAADNDVDAEFYANHLDEINNERKGIVASLVKEVKKIIKERYGGKLSVVSDQLSVEKSQGSGSKSQDSYLVAHTSLPSAIVLGNPDWKPSLLGLVANTCAEEFDRPVFLWGRDGDDVIKGSCRSEGTSNIVEIMRGVPAGVFMQFGGHKHSGGFAVSNEQVHFLEKHLNEAAEKVVSDKLTVVSEGGADDFDGEYVDMELTLDAVNWRLQEDIDKLAPFGMGNPKPLFIFKNVKPTSVRRFGKTQGHIEIGFTKSNGSSIVAIAFFAADEGWVKALEADKNKSIDLIASIEKSMFRGRKELRLRVVDIIL
jgi:single-stranded-DNA-specific exonuclease